MEIRNFEDYRNVLGTMDDDTIENFGNFLLIEAYAGNDSIENFGEAEIYGYSGKDTIRNTASETRIEGGSGGDYIYTSNKSTIYGDYGDDTIQNSGKNSKIEGNEGNDSILNHYGHNSTISGGEGADTIRNNGKNSKIAGDSGNDSIANFVSGTNSTISGGEGDDTISNNGSNVSLDSGAGNDSINNTYSGDLASINTGAGNDFIKNEGNKVTLSSGEGDDTISNSGSNVSLDSGAGNDSINNTYSGALASINTGAGNDFIKNEGNKVTLSGGEGSDNISNNGSNVSLDSGAGNDFIKNTGKKVTLSGGEGADNISNSGNEVTISGNEGNDSIQNTYGGDSTSINAGKDNDYIFSQCISVTIDAGAGDDSIRNEGATSHSSKLQGGEGNDSISNSGSSVTIDGGAGADTIDNSGYYILNSSINGGAGNDSIFNDGKNVTVEGGAGDDSITNEGNDVTLSGGESNDYISNNAFDVLFQYSEGDGSDVIEGFNTTSTLQIGDGNVTYSKEIVGNDIILTVGTGKITLKGANYLSTVNINGVQMVHVDKNYSNNESRAILIGNNSANTISNSGSQVRINAQGGNDSIFNDGANTSVSGGEGSDTITNESTNVTINANGGNDYVRNGDATNRVYSAKIDLGAGNDYVINWSKDVTIEGGADDDSIYNIGSNVTIDAGTGNDSILNSYSSENSSINGGAGNDTIDNTGNKATLAGGAGDDTISDVGDNALIKYNAGDGNDYIADFNESSTLSIVGAAIFSTKSGSDIIVTVGDGSITLQGATTLSKVNIVETPFNIHNSDSGKFITGTNANDTIINTGDKATIQALRGEDSLDNNAASVSIDAGEGADNISNRGFNVTINASAGNDFLNNHAAQVSIDAGEGADNISNRGSNVTINANAGNDSIKNNGADMGDDGGVQAFINGGAGNDSIDNAAHDSTIDGAEGDDYVYNWGSTASISGGYGNDTIEGHSTYLTINSGADNDSIKNWSNGSIIDAGTGDDSITNEGDDVTLSSGEGADTIQNSGKNSKIASGAGNDNISNSGSSVTISGNEGNDSIQNTYGGDLASINTGEGNDSISNQCTSVTIDAGAGDDSIRNAQESSHSSKLQGGEGNDSIYNEGTKVTVEGGEGDDTIDNTANEVTISGNEGNDTIENRYHDVTIEGGEGDDTIDNIGSEVSISGNEGNDSINNRNSNVTITGGAGNDTVNLVWQNHSNKNLIQYSEGDGNDLIEGFKENSTLQIGSGNGTYFKEIVGNDIILTVGDGKITLNGANTLSNVNIDGVRVIHVDKNYSNNESRAILIGNDSANTIYNKGSQVTISALGGNDSIENDGSKVSMDGGAGNDSIRNWKSNATLSGGAGNDSIASAGDSVTIDGGAGNDSIFNDGSNTSISGGEGNDSLYSYGENSKIAGNEGNDTIENRYHDVTIEGGEGNDFIKNTGYGNNGKNVTINGGAGNDSIHNYYGNNLLFQYKFGDGNDIIYGFKDNSTLDINLETFASIKSGNDLIIKVGDDEITLKNAANLSTVHINGVNEETLNVNNTKDNVSIVGGSYDDTIKNAGKNVTIFGNGGNDSIENWSDDVTIEGGKDNDTVLNYSAGSIIDGGAGDDEIFNWGRNAKNVKINSGDGNDSIVNNGGDSVTSSGGSGNDTIYNRGNHCKFSGGTGDDYIFLDTTYGGLIKNRYTSIDGGEGNDTIRNNLSQFSTIEGGKGDDYIDTIGENALIKYNAGDGNDSIENFCENSTLSIAGGAAITAKSGNDVIVSVGEGKITLQGAAKLSTVNIVETPANIYNSDSNQTITGTNTNDTIKNTGEKVTIAALKGNDALDNNAASVSIDAGEGADNISNTGKNATIFANSENDTIYNNAEKNSIAGGAGNDSIFNHGDEVTISGGSGSDSIENYTKSNNVSIDAGAGADSITNAGNKATLAGGADNDSILSKGSSDSINGGEGEDFISLEGAYRNTVAGGAGSDTINLDWSSNKVVIQHSKGDGNDIIEGFNSTSTLQLGDGKDSYNKSIEGEDVIITVDDEKITLKGGAKLDKLNIDGVTRVNVNNTENATAIIGDRLNDSIKNSGIRVTVNALAGNDTVENTGSRASIDAGDDDDLITNTNGKFVIIKAGYGKDSISNIESDGSTIAAQDGNDYIFTSNSNDVSITGDDGDDKINVSSGLRNVIDGGYGYDTIKNSSSRSTIYGDMGDDTISNTNASNVLIKGDDNTDVINVNYYGGNDVISVSGGFRNTVRGGAGNDSIYISPNETELLIQHFWKDGNDYVSGFNTTSTLRISYGRSTYSQEVNGKDIIVFSGSGRRITLAGAATLPFVNIDGYAVGGNAITNTLYSNTLISGTNGNDTIRNLGYEESGSIKGTLSNITINAHSGNDSIRNERSNYVTINAGAGSDTIYNNSHNVLINAGDKHNDYFDEIENRGNSSTLNGGEGRDSIKNYGNDNVIQGGAGNDYFDNFGDNVTFVYQNGEGNDSIFGFNATSTLSIAGADFTTQKGYNDGIIVNVGSGKIHLYEAAKLKTLNIVKDNKETPLNIDNANDDTLLVGTSLDDTISNSGANVTISALGGNDSIRNEANDAKIEGGAGNDSIVNDAGYFSSIAGGEGSDVISVASSSQVTINAGKADDTINLRSSEEIFIEYTTGDGNDKIYGFNEYSTLNIVQTEFTSATTGNDIVITVGDDKITLDGAATLSNPKVVSGTHATFTIKNGAVTYESDLPENVIKDAYQFNATNSLLTLDDKLKDYVVKVKADDAGKVKWHYGTTNLVSGSTLEYKLEDGENTATLTSKNYSDKITFDEDTTFNFGQIKTEVKENSTALTKGANEILFENNTSANVTAPSDYKIDVDTSNITVNEQPVNAKKGAGTVTIEKSGMSFYGYGAQFADLEVATESYFGKLAPMKVVYNSADKSYTIQNTACVKTLANDFTKIIFDISVRGDEKYAHYKVNNVEFLVDSDTENINVIETDGTTFKIQGKEIDAEKIGRVTIDEQITFSGTQIDFEGVKVNYTHNKPVIYSADGKEITISDAASITTGNEAKIISCEAGSYVVNGRIFETSADLTFTADTNEIKIPLSDAATEIYFDGVKVSGISGGGEIVFDLSNEKISIPSGANLNITSPEAAKLNLAAGSYTVDGKKISTETAFEITADKDNIKVPLSENAVTINGAAIIGTGEATIDNTNELLFSVLLPNGALVKNSSENIFHLTGKDSAASFGDANKKVLLIEDSTTYIEYDKENAISVGINRFMFETVEIKGSDTWTIETSGTSGIDKITGITSGATISTSTEDIDAGDVHFEVETSGAGTFNICGKKITSTGKNTYVVYGNSNDEIKVTLRGEEYKDDDSEAAGKIYNFDKAGDYTVNGITFHAAANTKAQTITRGVEFDLSTGAFEYDGLTLSGTGAAQINRYNAKLVSLTDGAKVSGSDEAKYQNRQFEISGAVELIGKKFETNEQIRCGLINVQDTIDNEPITLRGFVVDDKYVQIQSDCYEGVKVVDKKISSIEGVKTSAEIGGNGLQNASIITTQSGEFKIHDNTYKISDDSDGVTFVMDSRGNLAEINRLSGSVEGNFENTISVNGKAIRLTGASSIKVASDGENITGISNVAGDLVSADGKSYRKNIRVYELGGAAKLTTSANGTIIFSGNKFEMSTGKTFTLDNSGNVSGIEQTQSETANVSANVLEEESSTLATINLSTTNNLDEVIGDFSEGLTVNGVPVKVTDSTNFAVKNDAQNVYIVTTAPDTFTINGKTFTTYADKTIFKLDASGKVSEIATDTFYLYPEENAYLIEGDFNNEIIFNGQKFCVTGTNDASIFIGKETLIGVELARNSVEVVESGGASEIAVTGGGDITIGGKTFTTSDDFVGILQENSIKSFIGTLSGSLNGIALAKIKIDSEDNFSVTGDGEKVTAIENLQNGTLTGDDLDAITINGEKISLDDSEATLEITDGKLKTAEKPTEEDFLAKLKKENPDYIPVTGDMSLSGSDMAIIEDTSAKVSITAGKGQDTIYTWGTNVDIDLKSVGATEIFAYEGRVTVENYKATSGAAFLTENENIAEAIEESSIAYDDGKLNVNSSRVTFAEDAESRIINFVDAAGDLQKVGFASDDSKLDASKETGNLILVGGINSTITGGKGKNQIYLKENGESTIILNGKNTIENFNEGFDGDKISVDAANCDFSFDGEKVKIKSGAARATLENISSDAARILTVINGKETKTAIAQEGAVIAAGDDTADAYYGKKSGVDFTGFEETLTVDLSENFSGINRVTVGGGQNTLISSSRNETLTSNGTTEFIFSKDSGRDLIQNFNFDDDKISVGNETITAVNVNNSGGVRMEISGSAILTLENAQGKNFQINNFVALVDKNLTYNDAANYYVATSRNATLTVGEGAQIWLDGSHGKTFVGDIRTLDATTSTGKSELAGNDLDNRIFAGQGEASLWGGNGGDDLLVGGTGKNTFFYTNGNGNDTITGAHDGDVVYLSQVTLDQIASTNITADAVKINLKDGGSLQVNSNANITYQLADGSKFSANHAQAVWLSTT